MDFIILKSNGTMAIVLPHGVLFRGAAEGKIREKLLRSGNIYAVIGLPANLFYNTSIPTCIVVLKSIEMAEMYCLLMRQRSSLRAKNKTKCQTNILMKLWICITEEKL